MDSNKHLDLVMGVRGFFHVTDGETPDRIIVAFRGDTDQANAGTVGIRSLSIEEAEYMANELNFAAYLARTYVDERKQQ